jgi:hypothetical protein
MNEVEVITDILRTDGYRIDFKHMSDLDHFDTPLAKWKYLNQNKNIHIIYLPLTSDINQYAQKIAQLVTCGLKLNSETFDCGYYREKYPDLGNQAGFTHWIHFGIFERRWFYFHQPVGAVFAPDFEAPTISAITPIRIQPNQNHTHLQQRNPRQLSLLMMNLLRELVPSFDVNGLTPTQTTKFLRELADIIDLSTITTTHQLREQCNLHSGHIRGLIRETMGFLTDAVIYNNNNKTDITNKIDGQYSADQLRLFQSDTLQALSQLQERALCELRDEFRLIQQKQQESTSEITTAIQHSQHEVIHELTSVIDPERIQDLPQHIRNDLMEIWSQTSLPIDIKSSNPVQLVGEFCELCDFADLGDIAIWCQTSLANCKWSDFIPQLCELYSKLTHVKVNNRVEVGVGVGAPPPSELICAKILASIKLIYPLIDVKQITRHDVEKIHTYALKIRQRLKESGFPVQNFKTSDYIELAEIFLSKDESNFDDFICNLIN